jgi:hypothetical protein
MVIPLLEFLPVTALQQYINRDSSTPWQADSSKLLEGDADMSVTTSRNEVQISVLPSDEGRYRYQCCRVTEGGSIDLGPLMFSEIEMANVATEQLLSQKSASLLSEETHLPLLHTHTLSSYGT